MELGNSFFSILLASHGGFMCGQLTESKRTLMVHTLRRLLHTAREPAEDTSSRRGESL
jgi:hypothetical protein